ncbi:hypothetical protein LXA43DRAFT_1176693 [Ganoderma leucocontextum]|nr:hypothetical protein LXA43DRAFT_1176693 [Ganoderma leucocontextum]
MDFLLDVYTSPVQGRRPRGCSRGSPFTKLMLEGSGSPDPPRIARFSFEDADMGRELPTSLSGSFPSYYGLPYVLDSPPGYAEDAHSELSSRGPTTPPTGGSPLLAHDSPSLASSRNKPLDDPFSRTSPTLILGPRSFSPTQSLLDDTHSLLELYGAVENPRVSVRYSSSLLDSPSLLHSHFQPTVAPDSLPKPITMKQTIKSEANDPLVQNTRRSRTSANRRVTVHRLALGLPQACSRSNSLSAFITALENASPGWCQSLMDSTLPQSGSGSPQAPKLAPPSDSSSGSLGSQPDDSGSASTDGLQCNILETLDELEELAAVVRCLPIPRPRTMTLDEVATAFFPPANSTPISGRRHYTLPAVVSCSSSLIQLRGRKSTPTIMSEDSFEESASPERSSPSDTAGALRYTPDPNQPAIDNLVYHPKLARTLGLQSLPSWGAPDLAPRTPSPQRLQSPPTSSWSDSQPNRSPLGRAPPLPQTPEKASHLNPFKTPKSLRLTSLFRRRPSTPAGVDDWPVQDPRSGGSPVRNPARLGRGATSEFGARAALALGPTRSANGSPASKTSSRFSPILGDPPNPHLHPNPRQRKLDSFLLM